ncbi:MAG: YybH family protein [Gemmatimonadaceae bacterium]
MRYSRAIALLTIVGVLMSGCSKPTPATADSATPSGTAATSFDENAARAQILAADSAFVRAMLSKNVDSLMIYYEPDVVSLGKTAVKGTADLRKSYTEAVKNPPRSVDFESGGVKFSNDHSTAWDYGTVSETATGPNGKEVKRSGTYLNVWRNVGGRWKIVAEISSTS